MIDRLLNFEFINSTNHFIDRVETKLGHEPSSFFRNEKEIIHNMVRLTSKSGSRTRT